MPQLDRFAWASQLFWLLLLFFIFYFGIVKFIFPAISSTLKLRNKLFLEWNSFSLLNKSDSIWQKRLITLFVKNVSILKKLVLVWLKQHKLFIKSSSRAVRRKGRKLLVKFNKTLYRLDFIRKRS